MSDIQLHLFLYYMYEWKQWQEAKKIYIFFMSKENTSFINNNLKMRPSNAL